MSDKTTNLNLFKYNLTNSTDLISPFSIQTALNDNWDRIDSGVALTSHTHSDYALTTHTHSGMVTATDGLPYSNSTGYCYMKFSNNVLLQWGTETIEIKNTWKTISLPLSYSSYNTYSVSVQSNAKSSSSSNGISVGYPGSSNTRKKQAGSFDYGTDGTHAGIYWITIGY